MVTWSLAYHHDCISLHCPVSLTHKVHSVPHLFCACNTCRSCLNFNVFSLSPEGLLHLGSLVDEKLLVKVQALAGAASGRGYALTAEEWSRSRCFSCDYEMQDGRSNSPDFRMDALIFVKFVARASVILLSLQLKVWKPAPPTVACWPAAAPTLSFLYPLRLLLPQGIIIH